jgi:glycerol uptake facilitator-like aquaporin
MATHVSSDEHSHEPSLGIQGFTEFLGTFLLVAVILTQGRAIPVGIMLIAIVYFGANYSKCSFNPAASVALFERGDIDGKTLGLYLAAEILAGVAAVYWYYAVRHGEKTQNKNE